MTAQREAERLAALNDLKILDTAPEDAFDDIVRVAAYICGTPMALVTLIAEDRQWFKAKIGIEGRETPVEHSFCQYAIRSPEVMVVPDAREDSRFANNPYVLDSPNIRFYAGAPLTTSDGHSLGTLCVVDSVSRSITPEQKAALEALARQVMNLFELRRKNTALAELAESHARALSKIEHEVAQREKAEALHRESELRFRSIFKSAKLGIVAVNDAHSVVLWNPAAEVLFGYTSKEAHGLHWSRLLLPDEWTALRNRLTGAVSWDGHDTMETIAVRSDGITLPVEMSLATWNVQGSPYYIAIIQDITQRKAVERMKNDFISTVSHELRTPLTGIRGSLGLITAGMAGEISDDAMKLTELAASSTERLMRLINDLLDVEKISAGKVEFQFAPVAIDDIISDSLHEATAYAAQFDVALEFTSDTSDAIVTADRDRIIQVFQNLLSNAVKVSTADQVVTIATSQDDASVRIDISDHGPGIPAEFQDRIFQRFSQADSTDRRKKGGTGLGLNIAKAITEGHGGTLTYATEIGRGTTFTVKLPRGKKQMSAENPAEDFAPSSGKV